MPVAAQFRTDLAILKSFNSSLTVWQNTDIPIFIAPANILCWPCHSGIYFCLECYGVLSNSEFV
jgi:hypothetical protein